MGVVYRAEDTKLKRSVALKFLASHLLGAAEEKERFIREAQAAAALDHPNICTASGFSSSSPWAKRRKNSRPSMWSKTGTKNSETASRTDLRAMLHHPLCWFLLRIAPAF